MELSERFINKLEDEGFVSVFEWQDAPRTVHPIKQHKDKVSLCVADGSMVIDCNSVKTELKAGQRFNIPPAVPYSITVGETGVIYIVGEMLEEYL
jgi:mannose-6-phosphate isomerase-like protein (cupin superfamily)